MLLSELGQFEIALCRKGILSSFFCIDFRLTVWGFRVLSTSHWQSVSVANVSASPFNSAGERPRGAGSFVAWKKRKQINFAEKNQFVDVRAAGRRILKMFRNIEHFRPKSRPVKQTRRKWNKRFQVLKVFPIFSISLKFFQFLDFLTRFWFAGRFWICDAMVYALDSLNEKSLIFGKPNVPPKRPCIKNENDSIRLCLKICDCIQLRAPGVTGGKLTVQDWRNTTRRRPKMQPTGQRHNALMVLLVLLMLARATLEFRDLFAMAKSAGF